MTEKDLLAEATQFYLGSRDFNGLPLRLVSVAEGELRGLLAGLISSGLVSVNFGDRHPNPHILAFAPESSSEQLDKLSRLRLVDACVYPSPEHLTGVVERSRYEGEPFRLKLALGEPQLSYYSFDLTVLEGYRNDPRYHYDTDDVAGRISVTSETYLQGEMRRADKVFLQTFGFSYDNNLNRAVAAYLCYLAGLTPEHQQIWLAKVLTDGFTLHPEYHRMTMGEWPEGGCIFTAFLAEVHMINEMSRMMGRPALFRRDFYETDRPKGFGFLVRPTLRELNDFILLLDKLLSENIDPEFFRSEVVPEEESPRAGGKIVVRQKGSLRLLAEWLNGTVHFPNPGPKDKMIAVFKKIRHLRQRPAHAIDDNIFSQSYFKDQRELMKEAYNALRTLRLILGNHPAARHCEVPEWLRTGRTIWTY